MTNSDDRWWLNKTYHDHKKLREALRYYLAGKGWHDSLKAMNFAEQFHDGLRKDGKTPEFDHQVRIAHFVRTLPDLLYPSETISTVFLHDVPEDYDIGHEEIASRFGDMVSFSTELVTKVHRGEKKLLQTYFDEIAKDPIASIVKGADRIHNLQSMIGVFNIEKQKLYIDEVEYYFLPMLKKAKRQFPEQEAAYENIKHMLVSQIELIKAIHGAMDG